MLWHFGTWPFPATDKSPYFLIAPDCVPIEFPRDRTNAYAASGLDIKKDASCLAEARRLSHLWTDGYRPQTYFLPPDLPFPLARAIIIAAARLESRFSFGARISKITHTAKFLLGVLNCVAACTWGSKRVSCGRPLWPYSLLCCAKNWRWWAPARMARCSID